MIFYAARPHVSTIGFLHERSQEIHGQRENYGRIILGRNSVQSLQKRKSC